MIYVDVIQLRKVSITSIIEAWYSTVARLNIQTDLHNLGEMGRTGIKNIIHSKVLRTYNIISRWVLRS